MFTITNHRKSVLLFTGGVVVGFLAMVLQQAEGFGLVTAFILGPSWLLSRHLIAVAFRRRLRKVAREHALRWVPPEIQDGRLAWTIPCDADDGDPMVLSTLTEPRDVSEQEAIGLVRSMSGEREDGRQGIDKERWDRFKAEFTAAMKQATKKTEDDEDGQ